MPGAPARPAPDRQTPSRTHSPEKVRLQPLVQNVRRLRRRQPRRRPPAPASPPRGRHRLRRRRRRGQAGYDRSRVRRCEPRQRFCQAFERKDSVAHPCGPLPAPREAPVPVGTWPTRADELRRGALRADQTTPRTVGTRPSDSVTSPLRWTKTSSRVKGCGAADGVSSAGGSAQSRVAMAVAVSTSITVESSTWLSGTPMDECTRRSLRKSGHNGGGNLLRSRARACPRAKAGHVIRFAFAAGLRSNAELKLRATTELS